MNDKLKKTMSGVGVLAAFGLGGAALAGAQGDSPADKPTAAQSQPAEVAEPATANEPAEANETDQKVTGADADRAGQAALKSVGSGKVLSVDKESAQGTDKAGEMADAGEKPESAKEQAIDQKTAYSVEVQKDDGTTVDVALDSAFNVLSSETNSEQGAESGSERGSERGSESAALG